MEEERKERIDDEGGRRERGKRVEGERSEAGGRGGLAR